MSSLAQSFKGSSILTKKTPLLVTRTLSKSTNVGTHKWPLVDAPLQIEETAAIFKTGPDAEQLIEFEFA